jgi:hypothetical protein
LEDVPHPVGAALRDDEGDFLRHFPSAVDGHIYGHATCQQKWQAKGDPSPQPHEHPSISTCPFDAFWGIAGEKDAVSEASATSESQLPSAFPFVNDPHIDRPQPFGRLFNVKLDNLPFLQGAIAPPLDVGEVDEDILATLLLNEPIALGVAEPLDTTDWHGLRPPIGKVGWQNDRPAILPSPKTP